MVAGYFRTLPPISKLVLEVVTWKVNLHATALFFLEEGFQYLNPSKAVRVVRPPVKRELLEDEYPRKATTTTFDECCKA